MFPVNTVTNPICSPAMPTPPPPPRFNLLHNLTDNPKVLFLGRIYLWEYRGTNCATTRFRKHRAGSRSETNEVPVSASASLDTEASSEMTVESPLTPKALEVRMGARLCLETSRGFRRARATINDMYTPAMPHLKVRFLGKVGCRLGPA